MMKKIVPILICMVFLSGIMGIGLVKGTSSGGSGDVTITVANAAPTVDLWEIKNDTWVSPGDPPIVVPDNVFYYNVSVSDVDTSADIMNTTIHLRFLANNLADDPSVTYEFCYNETLGTSFQIKPDPLKDNYLGPVTKTTNPLFPNTINYSFAVTLNKTARDTNGATDWNFAVTVKDILYNSSTSTNLQFVMGPYVEMTYWTGAGTAFSWTGTAESNQTITFHTDVTANDIYNLSASYTGWFNGSSGGPWGTPAQDPRFWVKQSASPTATLLTNATVDPTDEALYALWYTSSGGSFFWSNTSHDMSLEFPAGVSKTESPYTDVKIWILARNG